MGGDAYESTGVSVSNPNLADNPNDYLYHIGMGKDSTDFPKKFGDVKFVCMGGSVGRFKLYAEKFSQTAGLPMSENLCKGDRYAMYKTGPVIWVNHGMGNPSIGILLVELIKMLHYAKATGVTFFRIGTSGGLGVDPGTVVVTSCGINGEMQPKYVQYILGKRVERSTELDMTVRTALNALAKQIKIQVSTGKTFSADDFYEGQGRLDGAFCEYSLTDKMDFLQQLVVHGVRNIEMEATCFSSMCNRAGIRGAIVCVTLLNRMKGDQIKIDPPTYLDYENRPFNLVTAYILLKLGKPLPATT